MEMIGVPPTAMGLYVKQTNNQTKHKHPEKKFISSLTPSCDPWFSCSKIMIFFSLESKSLLLVVLLWEDKFVSPVCDELSGTPGAWKLLCKRHKIKHACYWI